MKIDRLLFALLFLGGCGEVCNGEDDDGDGLVDEGFDADSDGLADCASVEICDGIDNDLDGTADNGFDADGDGISDCFDAEICDGGDDDGDGEVDEGFDSDVDGVTDCLDVEECDGVDNDGDGEVDESFDADSDGIPDCDEVTICLTDTPAASSPELGSAASYAVVAGSTVTNSGATVITGDLALSPGSAVTGDPVVTGSTHIGDAEAIEVQVDVTDATTDAAGRPGATPLPEDVSGMTLVPGVYQATSSLQIASDNLYLDGGGDPNATWIFQIGSTLTTADSVSIVMTDACSSPNNVFWQVGTSATLGTGTSFLGTIAADQSITVNTGAEVTGRLFARVGAVTLDTNLVTVP